MYDPERIRRIGGCIVEESDPLPHVRTHAGVEAQRTDDHLLVAKDRVRRKRAHERPSIPAPRPYRHAKVVEVLARPIRDRVQDDVAVSCSLGSPLEGHAYGVYSVDDEPRPDDWEPVGVAIDSV